MASGQKKVGKVRKPRVHITYDVETGGAPVKRELPFVVGVVGDFSGKPTEPLKSLSERKFIQVDRDNFNEVLSSMKPGLDLKVKNTLKDDGSEMGVHLEFNKMDDFDPINVVAQVEPLKQLYKAREKLNDLQAKMDRSEDLENALEKVLESGANVQQFASELGIGGGAEEPAPEAPAEAPEAGDAAEPEQPAE